MEIEEILKRLRNQGLRLTPQRIALIQSLAQGKKHKTAEEIHQEMQVSQPGIALGTVYRNLGLMVDKRLVNRLDFGENCSFFELNLEHHHHLICVRCGEMVDVPECPVKEYVRTAGNEDGFEIIKHHLELYGICKYCR
ncbi:MAG TPA: transcriptional repressor [Clostridia bacterium]|nr:transcriptional repressor [Clostridia bacterium]